jgi:hypothetical protein
MLSAALPRIRKEVGKTADRLPAQAFVTAMNRNKISSYQLTSALPACAQLRVEAIYVEFLSLRSNFDGYFMMAGPLVSTIRRTPEGT